MGGPSPWRFLTCVFQLQPGRGVVGGCQRTQLSSCSRQRAVSGPVPPASPPPTAGCCAHPPPPPRHPPTSVGPPARGSQLAPARSALSCVKRGRFSAPLHRTHPAEGEEAAGAAPGDARRREGSRDALLPGRPNPLRGFLVVPQRRRSKVSTTGRSQTHCSVSDGWDRPQGHWATKQGPCPRGHERPSPPPTAQPNHGVKRAQSLGAPHAAQALTQQEKRVLTKIFERHRFLLQVWVPRGRAKHAIFWQQQPRAELRVRTRARKGSTQPGALGRPPHVQNTQGSAARQPLRHPQVGHGPQQRDAAVPKSQSPGFPSPPGTPHTADGCRRSGHQAFPHATS